MKKLQINIILLLVLFPLKSFCQDFYLTQPILVFDGKKLMISYDIVSSKEAEQFYVWVEIQKKNQESLKINALSGDVGDSINKGANKHIIWIPEEDTIFLNEDIQVEVKAEKRIKSFKRGSMMLYSAVLPGYGQTKINKGKPWWLTGVAIYGILTAGIITHESYLKSYDSYLIEEDPAKRADMYSDSQNRHDISNTLIFTGLALWAANLCWVAIIPDKFQSLQHAKLSMNQSDGYAGRTTLLTLRLDF
jgi:hypothetical protein